jgi:hypothetical protein
MTQDIPDGKKGYLLLWEPEDHPENQRAKAYIDQWSRAWRRAQPLTDDDLLRWVLQFTRLNIEALSSDEQTTLGFDILAQFIIGKYPLIEGPRHTSRRSDAYRFPDVRFSVSELVQIQTHIAEGLRMMMMDPDEAVALFGDPQPIWKLPTVSRHLSRITALGYIETRFSLGYSPEHPVAMVVNAVADFIARAGQHLRVCAQCRTLFVANKRQAYCTPACSQAKRTQRKKDRMRPVPADEPHWYTRQQTKPVAR